MNLRLTKNATDAMNASASCARQLGHDHIGSEHILLSILAIPPILTNTCVGFMEVPPFMLESAKGIGMTEWELLFHVRFPLALPLILAGIRSALVEVIASATLAAKIGAGGLGEIIFTGLGLNRTDLLLIGGILVGMLSLGSLGIFSLIRRILMPYKYRRAV